MDGEVRVGAKGQVFEAAPNVGGVRGPKKLPGSNPRNWETRGRFECAAIVATVRGADGHPRHLSCCLPVADDPSGQHERGKYQYCHGHWPFQRLKQTQRDFVRGLRKYL